MPIANYSTTVPAMKSVGEIQGILVAHGAKSIIIDYNGAELRNYFETTLMVDASGTIPDVVARLDTAQQAAFVAEVQRRLVYGQPGEQG